MGLLDRVAQALPGRTEERFGIDPWISEYLIPASWQQFSYGGATYPVGVNSTYGSTRAQEISGTLPGYSAALRRCPPAFAAQMVRATVLSQARFTFRVRDWFQNARQTYGTRELDILERPWLNATTGELISRVEWHAGLAGNAYVTNWSSARRLRVLRPDWVAILYGSQREPDYPQHALDGEILAYIYQNGGLGGGIDKPELIRPDSMAHWSPIPDPENAGLGMSWLTPAVRELQGDTLATEHKVKFFENSATPNMVVKGLQASSKEQFLELVDMLEEKHAGVRNAYKTLYLTQGADATVVGSDLRSMDFTQVQGGGESRISSLSRVHPVILGLSEGLKGAALNAGNFGMARRIWGDTWIYPTLGGLCASLAPLVTVPGNAELWYDVRDIPILHEDAKDAADIIAVEATTIATLVKEGFTPDSVVAAVKGRDSALLKHTGLMSVQLQPPGSATLPAADGTPPALPAPPPAGNGSGRSVGSATHPAATAHLMEYWAHGEGAAKIAWGAPHDYDRCLVELGKYVRPDEVHGLCANLHHKALGVWPGQEHGGKGHH